MKKALTLCAIMIACSSCSQSVAIIQKKFQKLQDSIITRANALWSGSGFENNVVVTAREFYADDNDDFITLLDEQEGAIASDFYAEQYIPQSSITPGRSEKVPSIASFTRPLSSLAGIFTKIYFNTDQYYPKSDQDLVNLKKIAKYLKAHPNTYVFIEGHCDKRASEEYNLALGTKRANRIRTMIIQYGGNPSNLFTISYGKERLASYGNTKSAHAQNRRVGFKIYTRE